MSKRVYRDEVSEMIYPDEYNNVSDFYCKMKSILEELDLSDEQVRAALKNYTSIYNNITGKSIDTSAYLEFVSELVGILSEISPEVALGFIGKYLAPLTSHQEIAIINDELPRNAVLNALRFVILLEMFRLGKYFDDNKLFSIVSLVVSYYSDRNIDTCINLAKSVYDIDPESRVLNIFSLQLQGKLDAILSMNVGGSDSPGHC